MFSISYETHTPGNAYLLLTFDEEISLTNLLKYVPRIMVAIEHHKCYRMVEDYRKATMSMKASDFAKIQNFQKNTLGKIGLKITHMKRGMVIDDHNISCDDMEFYKMLSINQGQELQVFSDMLEAIKWITSDQPA